MFKIKMIRILILVLYFLAINCQSDLTNRQNADIMMKEISRLDSMDPAEKLCHILDPNGFSFHVSILRSLENTSRSDYFIHEYLKNFVDYYMKQIVIRLNHADFIKFTSAFQDNRGQLLSISHCREGDLSVSGHHTQRISTGDTRKVPECQSFVSSQIDIRQKKIYEYLTLKRNTESIDEKYQFDCNNVKEKKTFLFKRTVGSPNYICFHKHHRRHKSLRSIHCKIDKTSLLSDWTPNRLNFKF